MKEGVIVERAITLSMSMDEARQLFDWVEARIGPSCPANSVAYELRMALYRALHG